MRIDVVGPGAIGLPLAARLARAGEDVALVAREEQVDALAGGIRVATAAGPLDARLVARAQGRRDADLVLLAVKTQDVEEAARRVPPGPGAIVVLANGLAADKLAARALPGRRVVASVVAFDAILDAPGRATIQREGVLLLPREAPAEADVLGRAMRTERREDFEGARWTKLVINLGNGLNAATGLPAQQAYRGAGARVGARLLAEGLAVADAEGVRLAALPWADPRQLRLLTRLPPRLAGPLLALRVRRTFREAPAVGSTLQSLRRGKRTEVRWLNGWIVERGAALGVPTPANRAVVEAVERAEKGGGFTAAADLERWIG